MPIARANYRQIGAQRTPASRTVINNPAYEAFISSDTYSILKRTNNLYWAESAEFLADEYYRERELGNAKVAEGEI
jgi:hypothetical protein